MAPAGKTSRKLARVNGETCGICQACAIVCPTNAIDVFEHYIVILPDKCNGCGTCTKVCPVEAIKLAER